MSLGARCTFAIVTSLALLPSPAASQLLVGPGQVTDFTPTASFVRCDVADVDGDGAPDLVASLNGTIRWYQGDGGGSFAQVGQIVPDVSGIEIELADLDGDGRKDLIAATTATATMQVALADGAGGFARATDYALNPLGVTGLSLASGDSDSDGDVDVLVAMRGPLGFAGEARLFLNDGSGGLTLGPVVPGDAEHIVIGGLTGSLDGDELPDLLVVTQWNSLHTSTAWLGQPGGGVAAGWSTTGKEGVTRIADLDADGDADLLAFTAYFGEPLVAAAHLGAGDGSFEAGPATDLGLTLFATAFADAADLD
ncbi:MAG TPA: VCBS repeat-containing protein, partial [Planctomycetota bacterium]|nr:VCBS repeat-containing protein [Planctomycetota bacterium]